jgi:hypothetical protein
MGRKALLLLSGFGMAAAMSLLVNIPSSINKVIYKSKQILFMVA